MLYAFFAIQIAVICAVSALWTLVAGIVMVLAIVVHYPVHGAWLAMLAWKAVHRIYSYGTPFKETWFGEYLDGKPYDPQKTFWAQLWRELPLLTDIPDNFRWSVADERRKLANGLAAA
jgi:hypothetical protein